MRNVPLPRNFSRLMILQTIHGKRLSRIFLLFFFFLALLFSAWAHDTSLPNVG